MKSDLITFSVFFVTHAVFQLSVPLFSEIIASIPKYTHNFVDNLGFELKYLP
jgi:hypothetical protein